MMKREAKVAAQILRYLGEHPQACDTLEGVVRWWVMQQQLSESVELVQAALLQLEAEGAVTEQQLADGRTLYLAVSDALGQQKPQGPRRRQPLSKRAEGRLSR